MAVKITGGIVTYNNSDTILKCVQSIAEHTKGCSFQLYIYDNHSTDGTVELIKSRFPEIQIFEGIKNIGFGQGHNQIIRKIHSDFHVVINPDIFVTDSIIKKMAVYMESHPNIVQLTPEIRYLVGSVQYIPKVDPNFRYVILSKFRPFKYYRKIYTMEKEIMNHPAKIMSCTGCFSMIRTDDLKKVHGYDKRFFMYFEDADLSRRLRKYGDLVYHPSMHVYHAWKRDNMRSLRGACVFLSSMIKYYRKWR